MPSPSCIILYVADAEASTGFYADLLGQPPAEATSEFAMFALAPALMLGVWRRTDLQPPSDIPGGGGEVALPVADAAAVDARHADWAGRGLPILQAPTDMAFGRTFVAADPDGHRLRVFAPVPCKDAAA